MKKILVIIAGLLLAIGIVYLMPLLPINYADVINANITNETSLVHQEILYYDHNGNIYNKIYYNGQLVGVINNLDNFNNLINSKYSEYEDEFPDSRLGLGTDVYIVEEKSFVVLEDIDEKIVEYLADNDLLGIETTAVEFSTQEGVYEIIYVKDYNDFVDALQDFYNNFISQETIQKLINGETISSPSELGSVETGIRLHETISSEVAIVSPSEIFTSKQEIYNFLCYGRNEERQYYTVKEGDTLAGVGYYFGDMSPRQIMMLNPDILKSESQIVTPGMELNVTYYTSPITIEVTKENLSQQFIVPDTPEYIEDSSLEIGEYEVRVEEEIGIKNMLYKETWINGVLQSGELISENVIKESRQGVIAVGTKQVILVGTGNFIWPVDNVYINCHFGCYPGHTGTDITNRYEKYAPIYAADSGVVDETGYRYDMGNYVIINHLNGIRTMYMHLNVAPFVVEGEAVKRGQVIGQMGTTGTSTGVHLHLTFEVNGTRVDACNYLPCNLVAGG